MKIQTPSELSTKRCQACEGGVASYSREQSIEQLAQLGSHWELSEDSLMISRRWKLKNFVQALELTNAIGQLAEAEQHHPDLHITGYRMLRVDLTTHAIQGLSENDFILAAKIDQLAAGRG